MLLTSFVAAIAAVLSVLLKITRDARIVALLRRAEENDRNARQVLDLIRERVVQTTEHRDDAQETLKAVVRETSATKDTVEARSDEIVAAVQQLTCSQPPPGRRHGDKGEACGG